MLLIIELTAELQTHIDADEHARSNLSPDCIFTSFVAPRTARELISSDSELTTITNRKLTDVRLADGWVIARLHQCDALVSGARARAHARACVGRMDFFDEHLLHPPLELKSHICMQQKHTASDFRLTGRLSYRHQLQLTNLPGFHCICTRPQPTRCHLIVCWWRRRWRQERLSVVDVMAPMIISLEGHVTLLQQRVAVVLPSSICESVECFRDGKRAACGKWILAPRPPHPPL